jgi:hypothetical protein
MSSYIEIDSGFRNREQWPFPGEFEIPISQTGNNDKHTAIDPVSYGAPLIAWTSNRLLSNMTSTQITAVIENDGGVSNSTDDFSFILFTPQQIIGTPNRYTGLILTNTRTFTRSVIITYLFMGFRAPVVGPPAVPGGFRCKVTFTLPVSGYQLGDTVTIDDQTDFSIRTNPVIYLPNARIDTNSHVNFILYNETRCQYREAILLDPAHVLIFFESIVNFPSWLTTDNYSVRKEPPILTFQNIRIEAVGSTTAIKFFLTTPQSCTPSIENNFYKNDFLRIFPILYTNTTPIAGYYGRIISYEYQVILGVPTYIFTVAKQITIPTGTTFTGNFKAEIVAFTKDNLCPYTYTGTQVQQQSCYEFELINLTLPNLILASGNGGKIAFYPYVYAVLSNSSISKNTHLLQSNNPAANNMIFRIPIYDIQDPDSTPYVRLIASNMIQIVKFNPYDTLYFAVLLPNGDIFQTEFPDFYSPRIPNVLVQVSAIFRYKRV